MHLSSPSNQRLFPSSSIRSFFGAGTLGGFEAELALRAAIEFVQSRSNGTLAIEVRASSFFSTFFDLLPCSVPFEHLLLPLC